MLHRVLHMLTIVLHMLHIVLDILHIAQHVYFSEWYSGSVCAFSCPTGYSLTGPSSVECLSSQNWASDEVPDCEVRIMVSGWMSGHAVAAQPTWRALMRTVTGRSAETEAAAGIFIDETEINCAKFEDELAEFEKYLDDNNIEYSDSDLDPFRNAFDDYCN